MYNKSLLSLFLISIFVLQALASPFGIKVPGPHGLKGPKGPKGPKSPFAPKAPVAPKGKKLVIHSIYDKEFGEYGKVVDGYSVKEIVNVLKDTPVPAAGEPFKYVAEDEKLMATNDAKVLGPSLYGGLPYQLGYCNGHNTKMNCLEYHRDSEFNVGVDDFVLLVAKRSEIENNKIDSSKVKAFRVPKGVLIEVFATTLHYAPCHTDPTKGFQVLITLPKGTNLELPETAGKNFEDKTLFASNKWLYAHKDTAEAESGAYIGITGENIDIAALI